MSRILFWLALAFLVTFAIRSKIRGWQAPKAPPPPQPQPRSAPGADAGAAETMLRCAHCGVHYPASETVALAGRDYCSHAHAKLASR